MASMLHRNYGTVKVQGIEQSMVKTKAGRCKQTKYNVPQTMVKCCFDKVCYILTL